MTEHPVAELRSVIGVSVRVSSSEAASFFEVSSCLPQREERSVLPQRALELSREASVVVEIIRLASISRTAVLRQWLQSPITMSHARRVSASPSRI
jgi:hypothetical protein